MSRPGFSIRATKANGKLSLADEDRYRALAKRLPDGEYDVVIEKHVESRTLKQNAYFHAVIVDELAEYWGVDHDDAHELIKQHCNPKIVSVINKETGEVDEQTIAGSTAKLKKDEWGPFIERCQRWAAEKFNVVLPDPNPEWMFEKNEAA